MRARFAASAVLVALVLGGTTACTFVTPQATTKHYDPSDGIGTTLGDVEVRNALLLTGDGTTASLLINFINTSKYGVDITVQYESASKGKVNNSVYVNAGEVASLGGATDKRLILSDINAPAGALFPVFIQYGDVTGKQLWLPVLDGGEAQYTDLLPSSTPAG